MNSATTNQTSSSRNRWARLGIQTAFGLAPLWLWARAGSRCDRAGLGSARPGRRDGSGGGAARRGVRHGAARTAGGAIIVRAPRAAGSHLIGARRPGVRLPRGGARAVDAGAGGAARGTHGAGSPAGRLQLHAAFRGGRRRRTDVERDGRVTGAAAELLDSGPFRLAPQPRGFGLAGASRRA